MYYKRNKNAEQISTTANISYPSSSAAVVFGGHLSTRSRLTGIDRKSPTPDSYRGSPLRVSSYVMRNANKSETHHK